ncbi:MAG: LAGLIDADG family homing endonuclease [Candidatus Blackburnbacteria bacterium]|nr:LAGLIDADG family homing endonuclease [Candidatus Blackburnbacteria bacterium]
MPTSSTDNASSADNQQATNEFSKFYYTGFCVGELSCSIIRATHKKGKGFYFTPDLTVSNADRFLLEEVNRVIASEQGIISPIKGGYNLKFRGRRKVEFVLNFFRDYPVLAGDIAIKKLEFLGKVLPSIGKYSKVQDKIEVIEKCRKGLKNLKLYGFEIEGSVNRHNSDATGFFLSGIMDAEGSCGLKKSGLYQQPFFAVAMKDRKIIELAKSFLGCGYIHKRSDDGLFHWEVGSKKEVLRVAKIFMNQYPSRLSKMRERLEKLIRSLNDYTLSSEVNSEII